MEASDEVRAAIEKFNRCFSADDAEGVKASIADDEQAFIVGTQFIGTGREEWVASLTKYANDGAKHETGEIRAWAQGDIGWAAGEQTMVLPDGLRLPMRMTAVLRRDPDGVFRILHQHLSFAVPDAVSDEHAHAWREQLGLAPTR